MDEININHQHSLMVSALAKPGEEIASNMTGVEAHLLHMVVGVSGESGELLDAIKKHVIYKKPLDVPNVVEELGDIEFYLEGIRSALGVTREQTIRDNIRKLSKRYASGNYTNDQAQARADKIEGE